MRFRTLFAVRLYPERENEFFVKDADAEVTFIRAPGGEVTGLVLHSERGVGGYPTTCGLEWRSAPLLRRQTPW